MCCVLALNLDICLLFIFFRKYHFHSVIGAFVDVKFGEYLQKILFDVICIINKKSNTWIMIRVYHNKKDADQDTAVVEGPNPYCPFSQQKPSHTHMHTRTHARTHTRTHTHTHTDAAVAYVVDHEVHDGLWHEVTDALVDDGHVGVHQVADRLHLPLQLGVHGEVLRGGGALTLHLDKPTAFRRSNGALGNPNGKLGLKLEIKKFEIETFNTINPNINIGIGKFQ